MSDPSAALRYLLSLQPASSRDDEYGGEYGAPEPLVSHGPGAPPGANPSDFLQGALGTLIPGLTPEASSEYAGALGQVGAGLASGLGLDGEAYAAPVSGAGGGGPGGGAVLPPRPTPPPVPPSREPAPSPEMGPPAPGGGVSYRQLPGGNLNAADIGPTSLYFSGENNPSITASVDRSQGLGGAAWLASQSPLATALREHGTTVEPNPFEEAAAGADRDAINRLSAPEATGPHEGLYSFGGGGSRAAREAELEDLRMQAQAAELGLSPALQRAKIAATMHPAAAQAAQIEAAGRVKAADIAARGGVAREAAGAQSRVGEYLALSQAVEQGYQTELNALKSSPQWGSYSKEDQDAALAKLDEARTLRLRMAAYIAGGGRGQVPNESLLGGSTQ